MWSKPICEDRKWVAAAPRLYSHLHKRLYQMRLLTINIKIAYITCSRSKFTLENPVRKDEMDLLGFI